MTQQLPLTAIHDAVRSARSVLVAVGLDATICSLTDKPDLGYTSGRTAMALQRLAETRNVILAVLSGGSIANLRSTIGVDAVLAGSDGLEISGKGFNIETRQQAAFALIVDALSHGAQVAAAASVPPVDLPLRDDLRTRLAWGHVFALEPLAEGDARSVLRREADRRGIFLSDEVMAYLLTRFSRDLKHLMALLDRLDEFALAEHRAITVPLLKRMFEEEGAEL